MLTSLILQIKSPSAAQVPAQLGRAAQGLLLEMVAGRDPDLAQQMHQGQGPKPYTVSNLMLGRRQDGTTFIQAGEAGWLRFTGLTAEVSRQLLALAQDPPASVILHHCPFTVTGATLDPAAHPWAGGIDYQEFAATFLLNSRANRPRDIQLDFTTPTTFRSQGRSVPLPLPELVFGSLLNRWQVFAPVGLHPDIREVAAETVVLNRYRLRSRGVPTKGQGVQIGFTGQVTFTILDRDPYWLTMLHLLAAFAFFSGVGANTTTGMGQVKQC